MALGPNIRPTRRSEIRYEQNLRRAVLNPLLKGFRERTAAAARDYETIRQSIRGIGLTAAQIDATAAIARQHMTSVNEWHKRRFTTAMRRHLGIAVDLIQETPLLLEPRVAENVRLIRTIPPRLHERLTRDIVRLQMAGPFDEAALRDTLRKGYDSAGYNLRRLTRDQTSKLVGQLNQARQTEIGVEEYIWRTAGDQRVRPLHQLNEGEQFRWDDPPADTGHPGTDVMCRCVAIAIVEPPPTGLPAS